VVDVVVPNVHTVSHRRLLWLELHRL
jgi:hypothetical protein